MINKNYCMSSYLAFRYIEKDDMDFLKIAESTVILCLSLTKNEYLFILLRI